MKNKRQIRLTEGELHNIVKTCVKKIIKESEEIAGNKVYNACLEILSQTDDSNTLNDILSSTPVNGLTYAEAESVCNVLDAFMFGSDTIYDDGLGDRHSMVDQKVLNLLRRNVQ